MHAASVTDTLGVGFLILGMSLQAGFGLVTLKLVFLLALFFFTGPVVTHALAQAACMRASSRSWRKTAAGGPPAAGRSGRREAAIEFLINSVLLTLLAVVTIAIVRQRNLFGVVILAGVYSFLMASVLIVLDAVDVAMTEASVGAGVSTVLLLATLHLDQDHRDEAGPRPVSCRCSSRSAPAPSWSGARWCCRRSAPPTRRSTSTSRRATSPTLDQGDERPQRRDRRCWPTTAATIRSAKRR